MSTAELTRIDREIEIQAPPERVWRALTDAKELSEWFQMEIEGEIVAGNDVWMTSTHAEHAGQRGRVRIVELTKPGRVVWRWHPGAVEAAVDYSHEPQTTVTFTLEPTAKGTRLSVSETGFDEVSLERRAKVYADNTEGWATVFVWLQKYVEASR
jgi:uncharacterized protein YndB with AHSA1/START domain